MRFLAKVITYLFFPGVMGFLGYVLIGNTVLYLPWHVGFNLFLPLIPIFYLKHKGKIKGVNLYDRKERFWPLLIALVLSLVDALLFVEIGIALIWQWCFVGLLFFVNIITFFGFKISLHAIGVGSFFGLAVFTKQLHIWTLLALFLVIIVYWARRKLQAHSHIELFMGLLLSILLTFVSIFYK